MQGVLVRRVSRVILDRTHTSCIPHLRIILERKNAHCSNLFRRHPSCTKYENNHHFDIKNSIRGRIVIPVYIEPCSSLPIVSMFLKKVTLSDPIWGNNCSSFDEKKIASAMENNWFSADSLNLPLELRLDSFRKRFISLWMKKNCICRWIGTLGRTGAIKPRSVLFHQLFLSSFGGELRSVSFGKRFTRLWMKKNCICGWIVISEHIDVIKPCSVPFHRDCLYLPVEKS